MPVAAAPRTFLAALALAAGLAGCNSSHLGEPDMQGPAAMVQVEGGPPRLWLLEKQEEVRTVGAGRRGWRDDTYYHFSVRAFDPLTARPLWKQRLLTYGDDQASGTGPSRVIGSASGGTLLGQDGRVVWLLVGDNPLAVDAEDGHLIADAAGIEARNPELKGLLPSDGKRYGFDRGLVLMTADARQMVLRGPELRAEAYVPSPVPSPYPDVPAKANGMPRIVPMLPFGEIAVRHVTLAGEWLGLYSDKEAADVADDTWGDNVFFPYSILDEGELARRTFWRARMGRTDEDDPRYEALSPIAGAPGFLKGRFLTDPRGEAIVLADPEGVAVWHSTRIDSDGRLALSRVDAQLNTLWTSPLPLSETGTINRVETWVIDGHVVAVGMLETVADEVHTREQHLVSVALADGRVQGWNLPRDVADP